MTVQIDRPSTDNRERVIPPFRVHGTQYPPAVYPRPHLLELAKIYLWVEVSREIFAVDSGVYVENVYGVYLVEVVLPRESGIRIYDARVEADTENRVNTGFLGRRLLFPFVIRVPRRIFGDLLRVFVNGSVHVGHGASANRFGADARLQDRHVNVGRSKVDDDGRVRGFDEFHHLWDVHRVYLPRVYFRLLILDVLLSVNAFYNSVALRLFARSDADIAENVVILSALVCRDVRDSTGSAYKYIRSYIRLCKL